MICGSVRCVVVHLTSLWNLSVHCHTKRRYLSVECQVMGVYRAPQSPQKIFVENGELLKVVLELGIVCQQCEPI